MKKTIKLFMALGVTSAMLFSSCKKTDDINTTDYSTELSAHSDDQSRVSEDVDLLANDGFTLAEDNIAFGGRNGIGGTTANLLCNGVAVLDSAAGVKTLTVTYNGLNCIGNRRLEGVVAYSMPIGTRWRDAGSVLTINIQQLRVTRIRDNRSVVLNGTQTITNVSGGLVRNLSGLGTITHEILSNALSITFDNGNQRNWQVAKRRVFTYNNGIVITTTGIHTDGNINNIAEWGTNRFGNPFITQITQPLVVRQDCNFRLTSGEVAHQRMAANAVVTFGLDAAGNLTGCPAPGTPYYFKVVWTGANGVVRTAILPY
jgi:hypothetical protein